MAAAKEKIPLGPTLGKDEEFFAVAHIFASFNDTFVVSRQWRTAAGGRRG